MIRHAVLKMTMIAAVSGIMGALAPTQVRAAEKSFDLTGFSGLSAARGIQMQVSTGANFKVISESDDPEMLDLLEVTVRQGILKANMNTKALTLKRSEKARVTLKVTMPDLTQAEAFAGATITADTMAGPVLKLTAGSGSAMRINTIKGAGVTVKVSEGAKVNITKGVCETLSAGLSEGSTLFMNDVKCAAANVTARHGSNAAIRAKTLSANASSGAKIDAYGVVTKTKINASSGGKIRFP